MRRNEGGIFNLDNFDEMSNADVAGSLIFSLVTVASACSVAANVKLSNLIDDIRDNPDSEDLDKLDVNHSSSMVYLTPAVSLIATLAFVFSFRSQNAHGKIASRVASGVVSAASIITSGVDLDRASNKLYEYITDRDLPESLSGDAWHAAGFSRVFATTDQVVGAFGLMATAFAIYNFMKRDNNQIAPDPAGEGAQELTDRAVEAAAREPEVARQQGAASRGTSGGVGRDAPPPDYEEGFPRDDPPPYSPSSPSSSPSSAADTNNTNGAVALQGSLPPLRGQAGRD